MTTRGSYKPLVVMLCIQRELERKLSFLLSSVFLAFRKGCLNCYKVFTGSGSVWSGMLYCFKICAKSASGVVVG